MFEDPDLVERLNQGNNAAWSTFFKDNSPMIIGIGYRMGVSEQDVEEIIQETMMNAYMSIGNFMNRGKLSTWVYSIARNCYRAHLRKSIKLKGGKENYGAHLKVQGTDTDGQTLRHLEARSDWVNVRHMIYYCHSPEHYETLCRRVIGYKFNEISEEMDCPLSTAGSRMQTARNNLHESGLLQ